MDTRIIFGYFMIAYGIGKILLTIAAFTITEKQREIMQEVPLASTLFSKDTTFAFKFSKYILLSFAIFSLVHGLSLIHALPHSFEEVVDNIYFQYLVSIAFGVSTTIFYILVLYTDLPISKDKTNYATYKICLWSIGIPFLLFPVVWELIKLTIPFFRRLSEENTSLVTTMLLIGIVIVATILIIIMMHIRKNKYIDKVQELVSENTPFFDEVKQYTPFRSFDE